MKAIQKQPLHLLLAFQQPKHQRVNQIIEMVLRELMDSKTQYLTIYDQYGLLTQQCRIQGNLTIKYENQQLFDNKLYECYKSGKSISEYFFTSQYQPQYYIPQAILFTQQKVLLGLPFEYLKAGEIQFCNIHQFDVNQLHEIYKKYSMIEQREGK